MKIFLALLWGFGPASLINFPVEIWSNGLPHWPARSDFIPREEGDFNHFAKNAVAAVVKADWGFWGQGLAFAFWASHIIRWVL